MSEKQPISINPPKSEARVASASLEAARRVLALEAEALSSLSASLDQTFVKAVEIILAAEGRVIVSGMGKSGHVGRKIAATMASVGTPAHFVHPGEASHGDLGMITRQDVLLCLSNSGETNELSDLIAHSRRFSIPLIAMVGRAPSSLSQAADCCLLLPSMQEACPMGLAPTTSTTMMLALGDALAVALLERRGFTAEQFRMFHPGGKLGKSLVRVGDIMHDKDSLPLAQTEITMQEALIIMTTKSFGCLGVVDAKGMLVGVVTDGDLRRHMSVELLTQKVESIMTRAPRTIGPDVLAVEAAKVMNEDGKPITSLFVVEGGRPVGILHIHDILRAGIL